MENLQQDLLLNIQLMLRKILNKKNYYLKNFLN